MWGMYGVQPKPGPTMPARILRALQQLGRAVGRAPIMQQANVSVQEWEKFNHAMRILIANEDVVESCVQLPGTGNEGPPVYEYTYTLKEKK